MAQHNVFKNIAVVPTGKSMVDHIVSHQPPTILTATGPPYDPISRLRQFYIRKVNYADAYFRNKLAKILRDSPRLTAIHPFHADLIRYKYQDHYELALGQISSAETLIMNIHALYVKLLKTCHHHHDDVDRLFESLKLEAMGRMCTVIKMVEPSLSYLERVRHDMAGQWIDPNVLTVFTCGCDNNPGKSTFLNSKATWVADPSQTFPFSFGHANYKGLRYQVIDTPGPVISTVNINIDIDTALDYLPGAVFLFFLDLSGRCGYSVGEQAALFEKIRAAYDDKPLIVVCCKGMSRQPLEGLSERERKLVREMMYDAMKSSGYGEAVMLGMSSDEEGVTYVEDVAVRRLMKEPKRKIGSRRRTAPWDEGQVIRPLRVLLPEFPAAVHRLDVDPDIRMRLREREWQVGRERMGSMPLSRL